jgi:peptide/nickel transport system substrate-binding protein
MKNLKMVSLVLGFTVVFLFLGSALYAGGGQEEGEMEGDYEIPLIRIGMVNDQGTTDMFKEHGVEGLMMKQLVYNGLVELDENFGVVPGLAERWDITADGLEYTFFLRKGVIFHNGREFTADDVKWTYEKYIDINTGYSYKGDFDMITAIDIVDDYTIKLSLDVANSAFLAGIASGVKPIMAKESYKVDDDGLLILDQVIGTGPYKFIEWIQDSKFKLEAYADYWAGKPNVAKIEFEIIPDDTVRYSALQAGDLDIIRNPPPNDLVVFLEDPTDEGYALDVMQGTQSFCYNITLNNVEGPFKDKRVRQAVMYGVDLDVYPKIITKGMAENANGCFPKSNVWGSSVSPPKQDVERAKRLLAEAGYSDGLEISVLSSPAAELDKVGEIAQAQLAEIGIKLNVDVVEIGRYFDRESKMDWDMKTGAHSISVDPAPLWNLVLRTDSPAWWWMGNYGSEEIDNLLDQGEMATDVAERQRIYNEINQLIQDDAGIVWLYNLPITYGYRTDLKGIGLNTRGDFIFSNNKGIPWITKE